MNVSEVTKIPYTLKVGCRRGNFSNPHNLMAKDNDRIYTSPFFPVLEQCRINTNMRNADTGIFFNSRKEIR